MKLFKKVSAMMVSLLMALAMMVPVAAEDSATITINNAEAGDTFDYVQIVEPDKTSKLGWKFVDGVESYFVGTDKIGTTEDAAIRALIEKNYEASKLNAALKAIQADSSITKVTGKTSPITVKKAGAYAVFGNAASETVQYSPMLAYISFTYNGNKSGLTGTTLTAKKSDSNVQKTHDEKDDVVEVGQEVTYTITAVVPYIRDDEKDVSYMATDKITGGEYVRNNAGKVDVTVKVGSKTLGKYPGEINESSFTVDLTDLVVKDGKTTNTYANQTIELTYKAKVTSAKGVENTVEIKGGHEGNTKYGSATDTLTSGQITLKKTGDEGKALKDAEFVVYRLVGENKQYIKFNANYEAVGLAENLEDAKSQTIKTDENGKAIVKGLDSEYTYYFEEVVAPEGYKVLDDAVDAKWNGEANVATTGKVDVVDTKVGSLPETGGIGTTIFTVGGCAIMVVAAALFFMNKKKQEK